MFEAQVARAKRICAGCAVRAECLAWAVEALGDGIAGGLTAEERRGVVVRRRRARPVGAPVSASRRERAAAGRAAIRAGGQVRQVAAEFGVTERTAERWAADVRRAQTCGSGAGGRGVA